MHIGIIEHLVHLSQRKYRHSFGLEEEKMLKSNIFDGKSRRDLIKWKTVGLIYHDRMLTQDHRLPVLLET